MRYFVIGPDGKSYGPAELAVLQQWVTEGRVVATSLLEVEETGQRVAASSIPELGLAPAPAPAPAPAAPSTAELRAASSEPTMPSAPAEPTMPSIGSAPAQPGYAPAGPGYAPAGFTPAAPGAFSPMGQSNTSGMGSTAAVPAEVRGWNWGAFLLSWIWAIGNSTWIGLLALVPYVGWIMAIVLGVKGSEWAWQNRRWDSVEHFKKTQRTWALAGLIYFLVVLVIVLFAIILPVFVRAREAAMQSGLH